MLPLLVGSLTQRMVKTSLYTIFCFRNFSPFLLVTLALQRTIAHDKKKVLENTQYSIHVLTSEIKICNIEIKKTWFFDKIQIVHKSNKNNGNLEMKQWNQT